MFFNETPTCTDTNNLRRADLEVGTNVLVSNSDGSFFTPITVINDENLEGLLCVHASNGSMTQLKKTEVCLYQLMDGLKLIIFQLKELK